MKKSLKRLLSVGLALLLLLGAVGITAFAGSLLTPNVVYNGSTRKVEFENALLPFFAGSENLDLFTEMKGLMPGDSVTQTITVGTKNTGSDTVRLFLRTEKENEDYVKLTESYPDWVTFTVKQGDKVLATGDLKDGVKLGEFRGDGKTELTVQLDIDINAGNDLQGLVASVDWVFTAEVEPYVYEVDDDLLPKAETPWLRTDHVNYIMGYSDGTVRPNRDITRAEVATIFFRLLTDEAREEFWATSCDYADVSGENWFNVAVSTLTKAGIIEGYRDGKFHPYDKITRAEFATMLSRFDLTLGKIETSATFPDVKGHWAQKYIEHAATRGWVLGYSDGTFRPDRNITRAETVAMINRILERAVNREGLLKKCVDWSDNYAESWYFYNMLEAGNYHDYGRSGTFVEKQNYLYERWITLYDTIDWSAMEKEWIRLYGN